MGSSWMSYRRLPNCLQLQPGFVIFSRRAATDAAVHQGRIVSKERIISTGLQGNGMIETGVSGTNPDISEKRSATSLVPFGGGSDAGVIEARFAACHRRGKINSREISGAKEQRGEPSDPTSNIRQKKM